MSAVLNFFELYENAIYFILGLGGIIYGWRFWGAWTRLKNAVYGLEREIAQRDVNYAAVFLFVLFMMSVSVFSIVTFSEDYLPVETLIATPTIDLLSDSSQTGGEGAGTAQFQGDVPTVTPLPTVSVNPDDCVPARININSPASGDTLRGVVSVEGTVDVEDFGFFQIEYARILDGLWLPISVKHNIIIDGFLVENWDTSSIPPGDYVLQLLVTDTSGLAYEACRRPIRIEPGEE
ncbi:MAG: hypothetical protein IH859_07610 [Chloroflexi bacterium]|nr:hypothetical protein [Chloroflexota bacterium]